MNSSKSRDNASGSHHVRTRGTAAIAQVTASSTRGQVFFFAREALEVWCEVSRPREAHRVPWKLEALGALTVSLSFTLVDQRSCVAIAFRRR